jgi:hypothetical protein
LALELLYHLRVLSGELAERHNPARPYRQFQILEKAHVTIAS